MTQRAEGPHFLVSPDAVSGGGAVLSGDDARHVSTVLRARPGAPVSLADGTGWVYQGRITRIARDVQGDVQVEVVDRWEVPAPRPALVVVHALPKGRKLDDVVQRCTEVGVDRLVPVRSARSQVELAGERADKAVRRWRAVAHAAAKQSRRARPLVVEPIGDWASAFGPDAVGAVLWEEADRPLRDVLAGLPPDAAEVVLGIGPEGGLPASEVEAAGVPAASLGPTILRTETAAVVAAAAVLYALGRLG